MRHPFVAGFCIVSTVLASGIVVISRLITAFRSHIVLGGFLYTSAWWCLRASHGRPGEHALGLAQLGLEI